MLLAEEQADLEVATVHLSDHEAAVVDQIWRACDEQALPLDCRRVLQENGLRAGVMGLFLPERLRAELNPDDPPDILPLPQEPGDSTLDVPWKFQRLRVRWGQRSEIIASGIRSEMTAFLRQDGGLSGKTFHQAQAILAATARPASDGAIILELAPEIHFGEVKQRYVAAEGAFRLSAARERFVPAQLSLQVPLSPGETLLLGSSGPPGSFGRSFFDDKSTRNLLMIRLAATQHESLYSQKEEGR
jgi:hypothetical protein